MPCPLWLKKLLIRTRLTWLTPAVRQLVDGGAGFLHYYNDRTLMSPHAESQEALTASTALGADVIDLALSAPCLDLLPSMTTRLPLNQRGYPPAFGLPELREAVAQKLREENGLALAAAEEILICNGASAAFSLALDTFLNPGDGVALFDPGSFLYPLAIQNRRGRVRWVPTEMEEGRLHFAMPKLIRALRRARLLVVNSPSNPSGGVLAPEDLEQIAWWADRQDVLIFSDEVYERFQYDGRFVSIGSLPKARLRTLTANSLSKSHGLAAHRVGWLAGHRHLLRPCLATAAFQCPYVSTLCQHLALAALELPPESFAPVRADFESRRRYVYERLRGMGLQPHWPAGGFFCWIPIQAFNRTGRQFAKDLLKEKRTLVLPGEFFGPGGEGYIRLSYATEDGRLREGLNRLASFVRQLAPMAEPANHPPLAA